MIKRTTLISFMLLFCVSFVPAQVPLPTHVLIVKAEDARRYDKTLADLSLHPNETIRVRAILAIGRIGDERAVDSLSKMLQQGPGDETRRIAAFALGEIESIGAADTILFALKISEAVHSAATTGGDQKQVRRQDRIIARLLEAAGKIAAANANDPRSKQLGAAVVVGLENEWKKMSPSTEVIRLGVTAILRARPAGSEETVRKFLAFTDPNVVADALNTLARLRAKNANRDVRDLLATHTHAVVRANAARVLGAADDKEAVDVLIKAATSDADERVRISSLRSLAAIRDPKPADRLIVRGEELMGQFRASAFRVPVVQNELVELFTTLGRLIPNSRNERAVNLIREFGKRDSGHTPEAYIARIRIAPGRGDDAKPEMTDWRQYSSLAQIVGEFSALEPTDEEGRRMKSEAPGILRPLAVAFASADLAVEGKQMMAAPDVLQAYARFKTADLGEIARTALQNKDVYTRAAAAGIIGDLPSSKENLEALNRALDYSILNDTASNDATLAIMDAIVKLDKKNAPESFVLAAGSLDHLVRAKVLDLIKSDEFKDPNSLPLMLRNLDRDYAGHVRPYAGKGTKLGQTLNTDLDYRRALSRKNGTVKALIATEKGPFTINFLPEDAPLTVDNFIKLARSGYFNGLEVHRVVPNFVMQDGDPRGDGNGGPGWSIRCEINMVPYERGAVGMALSGKDTGGSQWFVTHSPQPHLDGGYTVFGRVNETDMKVVDKIVRGDKIIKVRIVGK
jgi:cyclophilin family peptidyl-prolyl cis-trans isomerase/HEAT repeat protein